MIAGLAENVKSLFCNPNAKNNFELFGFVVIYWVFSTHFVSLVFKILLYIIMKSKLKKNRFMQFFDNFRTSGS
jgi:hemolysin-activating ACP:hemolysin acyltransferase